ncbi:lactose-binding lectin l-2-like [Anguilla rostrata]|uniref:lactose-binding lectin l-2-like n=1 Tax=Anguilla rostrata TaxID=7938 RepID=UPI0030D0F136
MVSFPMAKLIFMVVLSGLILASEQCQDSCPDGWKGFNDRCFKHFPQQWDWVQAESFCVSQGGNLASVHSAEEFQFLKDLCKAADPQENPFWIGLTDCQKEGTWMWSDGSKVDYQRWNSGEPNNLSDEDCVHSNWSVQKMWNDIPCTYQYRFICVQRSAGRA